VAWARSARVRRRRSISHTVDQAVDEEEEELLAVVLLVALEHGADLHKRQAAAHLPRLQGAVAEGGCRGRLQGQLTWPTALKRRAGVRHASRECGCCPAESRTHM